MFIKFLFCFSTLKINFSANSPLFAISAFCSGKNVVSLKKVPYTWLKESSSNFYNYSYSKLANVYFTNTLARFFEENKICFKAVSLHPGVVKTELVRFNGILGKVISIFAYLFMSLFFKDAYMGAQTTLHLCYIDYNSLINGGYYSDCKLDKISNLGYFV